MKLEIYRGDIGDSTQGVLYNQVGVIDLDRQWGACVIAACGPEDDPDSEAMARRIKASLEVAQPLEIEEIEACAARQLGAGQSPMRLSIYCGDVRLGDGTQGVLRNRIGVIDLSRPYRACIIAICGPDGDPEAEEAVRRIKAALMCYSDLDLEELERRAEEARALHAVESRATGGYMPA